jgi:hypothetical protein
MKSPSFWALNRQASPKRLGLAQSNVSWPALMPDPVAIIIKPTSKILTIGRPHRKNGWTGGVPPLLGERPMKRFALGQSGVTDFIEVSADLVTAKSTL